MNKLSWVIFGLLIACIAYLAVIDWNRQESPATEPHLYYSTYIHHVCEEV